MVHTIHPSAQPPKVPNSIIIVGAGVFGLSTTLSLLSTPRYDHATVILIDTHLPSLDPNDPNDHQHPQNQKTQNPHAASIDSSRIIRPDYAVPAYARLASLAQREWRAGFGSIGNDSESAVYRESGLVLTAEEAGSEYVSKARENARALGFEVRALGSGEEIARLLGTGGRGGSVGYVNWGSGWADSARALGGVMGDVLRRAGGRGEVVFRRGRVGGLLFEGGERKRVVGVRMDDGEEIRTDLTVVAAGAWSGSLVDLRGRAEARGQAVAYVPVTEEEKDRLKNKPVLLNLSTGMFFIPPVYDAESAKWIIKIARHSYGYGNPTTVSPEGTPITTSLPAATFSPIPEEGERECRAFLSQTIPWLADRPFSSTRICWYTDTPTGDFLIAHHPEYEGLFLATGGSGHGFKFLPVLGEKVVDAMEGRLEGELEGLWRWRGKVEGFEGCEDGSRGGARGMVLVEEWEKRRRWETKL